MSPEASRDGLRPFESLAALPEEVRDDRVRLLVAFDAAGLRDAVELAAELRSRGRGVVRVRPGPSGRRGRRSWRVLLTTRPMPPAVGALRRLGDELRRAARRSPGCRVAGWRALPAGAEARRGPPATL